MTVAKGLFTTWCDISATPQGVHRLIVLTEKSGGRGKILKALGEIVRSHYEDPDVIADDLKRLGYKKTAAFLRKELPASRRARSGDLGEILATEFVTRRTDYKVPVKRLRYKDGRELALRGDDLIGLLTASGKLQFLKGEAKSRKSMDEKTVKEARKALRKNRGRPSSHSLNFIAKRLIDSSDAEHQGLGRQIRDALIDRSITSDQVKHMIFAFSRNDARALLGADIKAYTGSIAQRAVAFRVDDHQAFIALIFKEALALGSK